MGTKRAGSVLFLALPLVMALAVSCADVDVGLESVGSQSQAMTAADPAVYPLAMGATNLQVGEVRIWNDTDTVYVQYVMFSGYELDQAHVCIATSAFGWTPPGQCPYKVDPAPPDTVEWTFAIPMADLGLTAPSCDTLLYLQAHATINDAATDADVGSAYGGVFKGRIAYLITCEPPPEDDGCTYTQGYWKNHPRSWPVSELTIGGVTYSKTQLINLLKTPPRGGDASLILGHQLIAALLNVAAGAGTNADVSQSLADAEAWMTANKDSDGRLPYGTTPTAEDALNPEDWDDAVNIAAVLDAFNQGLNGPAHCQ